MFKKVRILAILILMISQLVIVVNAGVTDGTIPHSLPNYISGTYIKFDNGYRDIGLARAATRNTIGIRVARYLSENRVPYISRLYSGLETGKLYKWQYTFSDNFITGVGDIAPTNDNYINIVSPANLNGHNLDAYLDTSNSFASEENPYVISGYTYSIPGDNYRMFYDSNNKTLTCLMILPDNYFDGLEALQMHCYLMVALGTVTQEVTENVTVLATDTFSLQVQGDYTELLNQIINKLDGISGSGLSEEEINQAIQDAITTHEEQLEIKTQNKLEELMSEIENYTQPYREASDEIKDALHGFSDVFNSTSTRSVFTFPAGIMPNGTKLWEEHPIDIGAAWLRIPEPLRALITVVATAVILINCVREAIFIIKFIIIGERMVQDD